MLKEKRKMEGKRNDAGEADDDRAGGDKVEKN